jgi:transcriptional regulator of NAD metabolism
MEAVAAAIVAFVKAIPAVDRIYQRSVSLYYAAQEAQDQGEVAEIQKERRAIVDALNQPGLKDETIRFYRRRLATLGRV